MQSGDGVKMPFDRFQYFSSSSSSTSSGYAVAGNNVTMSAVKLRPLRPNTEISCSWGLNSEGSASEEQ